MVIWVYMCEAKAKQRSELHQGQLNFQGNKKSCVGFESTTPCSQGEAGL